MEDVMQLFEDASMEVSDITTADLDDKIFAMVEARAAYEVKKKESSEAYGEYKTLQNELLDMLQKCGKTKYIAEGLGTVSSILKKSTKVPKDLDAKREMLTYFRSLGEAEYLNFVSVNSMTLNSYVNSKIAEDPDFILPGVGEQTITKELRFTKARSKK